MKGPWTRDENSASGEVFELRVWALLTEQSRGHLHVFVPTLDCGVDALVHRLVDGAYIPVQVKGRSTLARGQVRLLVQAEIVNDDLVVIIGGEVVEGGVGPTMLVIPSAEFRRLARLTMATGRPEYVMAFRMNPGPHSRWLPWLVPSDDLVERFGVPPELPALAVAKERPRSWRNVVGYLGESEVIRQLAQADDLNLFRPLPDYEIVEIAVRHRTRRSVIGLQVKTVSVDSAHSNPPIAVRVSTFRPAPSTYLIALAWMPDERRFHEECLVIPSEKLLQLARPDGLIYKFNFHPGSKNQPSLDKYRRALRDLCTEIEKLL